MKNKEIYSYTLANGDVRYMYRLHYYDALGKRREKKKSGFVSEKAAMRSLIEVKAALVNGNVKQVENEQLTVGEYFDLWFESNKHHWKISTIVVRERIIRRAIKPLIGKYKLTKLDKLTYQREFIVPLLDTVNPTTLVHYHTVFKIAINAAVDEELLTRNRFRNVTIPKPQEETDVVKDDYYSPRELAAFLRGVKDNFSINQYMAIKLISYTGLRRGECAGLKWTDLDFEENKLSVKRTRDQFGSRKPKTTNSTRTILIDEPLMKELASLRTWAKAKHLEMGIRWKDDSYVFISRHTAEPMDFNSMVVKMHRLQEKLKLKRVTIRGLRHTHATILLSTNKVSVKTISQRLGNTPLMIHNVYGHVLAEMEEESMKAFSSSLEASVAGFEAE